ncbi:hypothetical protein [Pacificitalea manganoxidans]|uniref:hypothetical protein n=1 Tax=Pacificitalea manganoxidans TaxID=1411902 RepID=UPI001E424457|nr:hypothetical protein [Pacificitalea manganoxidans]MDR6308134.1 hypothetical protein [Pacificitalea manganoxidans]
MPEPVELCLVEVRQGKASPCPNQEKRPVGAGGEKRAAVGKPLVLDDELDGLVVARAGSDPPAKCHTHPDPRVHAVIAQTRECGTLQAIARLRLVAPVRSKRVVILSSLPLPGFPVTRLVAFNQLARGLEHEPDPAGFIRMEAALRALRRRPVCGTRLSAGGLAADLPRDFKTDEVAKRFRRGRPTDHLVALCGRVSKRNGWPLTLLALRKPGGGHSIPAIVLSSPEDALKQAQRLWPDMQASCGT